MIFTFIANSFLSVLGYILSQFGTVTEMPLNIGNTTVQYIAWVYAFSAVFWPLQPILLCLTLFIPIMMALIPIRFILGSRMPQTYVG